MKSNAELDVLPTGPTSRAQLEEALQTAVAAKHKGDAFFESGAHKLALQEYKAAILSVASSNALYDCHDKHLVEPDVEKTPHMILFRDLLQSNKREAELRCQDWHRNDERDQPWDPSRKDGYDQFLAWAEREMHTRAENAAQYLPETYRLKYGKALTPEDFGYSSLTKFLQSPLLDPVSAVSGSNETGLTVRARLTAGTEPALDPVRISFSWIEEMADGIGSVNSVGLSHFVESINGLPAQHPLQQLLLFGNTVSAKDETALGDAFAAFKRRRVEASSAKNSECILVLQSAGPTGSEASKTVRRRSPQVANQKMRRADPFALVLGGSNGGLLADVMAFDTRRGHWQHHSRMNHARTGMGAAVTRGCMVVAGGYGGELQRASPGTQGVAVTKPGLLASVELFLASSQAWELLPPLHTARRGCRVVMHELSSTQLEIIVIGGEDEDYRYLSSIETIHIQVTNFQNSVITATADEASSWECIDEPDGFTARSDFGACRLKVQHSTDVSRTEIHDLDGSVIVVGGMDEGGPLNEVEISLSTQIGRRWLDLPPLVHARSACACAQAADGDIIAVGGSEDGRHGLRSCEVMTMAKCAEFIDANGSSSGPGWTVIAEALQHPRKRHAACFVASGLLVVGGIDATNGAMTVAEAVLCGDVNEGEKGWKGCDSKRAVPMPSMPVGDGRFDFVAVSASADFVV
eukprot:SAG31_NODE_2994_length_4806_cov_5.920693_1_plen_692_part_10